MGKREMGRERKNRGGQGGGGWFSSLVLALIGFLFLLCGAVTLVLHFRQLYYFDIAYLDLPRETGLTAEQIRENYDVLIDYNLLEKGISELEFPDFPMSEHGAIHFWEVKRIFLALQWGALLFGVFWILGLVWKIRRRDIRVLKWTSLLSLLLPALFGAAVALNWEGVFLTFHCLAFSNDYWLFDPATDPVIQILPDEFFLHCVAAILLCLLLGSLLWGVAYRLLRNRRTIHGNL